MQIGRTSLGELELKTKTLKRHFVVLGTSGSGKTVLSKCIIEEAVRENIPSIIIDPQGDIASLSLINDEEVKKKSLKKEILEEYKKKAEVRIFTPASSKGIPLSLDPLKLPPKELIEEEVIRALDLVSSSLLLLLGYNLEEDDGKSSQNFLYEVFHKLWKKNFVIKNFDFLANIIDSPEEYLKINADTIIKKNDREKLARKIRYLSIGIDKLLFNFGIRLSMEMFLTPTKEGKVPINVIYLNTLSSEQHKQFFIAMIGKEIYYWMLQHPSENIQLIFYIDEVSPYLPPHPFKPPAKDILKLLFKQGRKYGVSCLMNTQNPADVDYKAMSQANTWALGRMMAKQDLEKVKHILKALDTETANEVMKKLSLLQSGEFILISPDEFDRAIEFKVRRLFTNHKTLDEDSLKEVIDKELLNYFEGKIEKREEFKEIKFPETKIQISTEEEFKETYKEVLFFKMNYPLNKATKVAKGGWLSQNEVLNAELKMLPLWRLKCVVKEKGIFSTNEYYKNFYINSINGKILILKDKIYFRNIIDEEVYKLNEIKEEFEIKNKEDLPEKFISPIISEIEAKNILLKTFGIRCEEIKLIVMPIWIFNVRSEEETRQLILEGTNAIEIEGGVF